VTLYILITEKGEKMKRQMSLYVVALSFALCATSNVLADGPTFTTIDFPGAAGTQAWGITISGDIAGWYVSADTATHGFLKSRGQFISIDFPGAAYTLVNGISPRGDIIGEYAATLTGSGPHHGFVLSKDGVFTTIDYPGATYTYALGMNSRGDVLGSYAFDDNLLHTFVLTADPFSPSGRFKAIDDVPGANVAGGASATVAIAIHGDDIVGGYPSGGVGHGFLLSDGQYTTIDPVPGATFINVTAIDSRGEMLGRYTLNGVTHAYLLSGGQVTSFDFPGATFTAATAISPNGDILGRYRDANNVFHGFLLTGLRQACVAGN
jgi:uncharacterized membrane protein